MSETESFDLKRKELRKIKNRESAEKTRANQNEMISILQSKVKNLHDDVYALQVDNWMKKSLSNQFSYSMEAFPQYTSPILEHALF